MAGLQSGLGFSPYSTSKFAVVNMSEGLAMQVKPLGIGVTVVCPGYVRNPHQRKCAQSGRTLRSSPEAGPREPRGYPCC
jgi:NAD(P)-dependent dehydrogenase (short-subunit alcohol dehydrogenase family)